MKAKKKGHLTRDDIERSRLMLALLKENFRFHDLRHTAGSYLTMAGVPEKGVGEVLGHRSSEMTNRYAHLSPGFLRSTVNALPEWTGNRELGRKMVAKSENVRMLKFVSSGKVGRDGRTRTGDPLLPKRFKYPCFIRIPAFYGGQEMPEMAE